MGDGVESPPPRTFAIIYPPLRASTQKVSPPYLPTPNRSLLRRRPENERSTKRSFHLRRHFNYPTRRLRGKKKTTPKLASATTAHPRSLSLEYPGMAILAMKKVSTTMEGRQDRSNLTPTPMTRATKPGASQWPDAGYIAGTAATVGKPARDVIKSTAPSRSRLRRAGEGSLRFSRGAGLRLGLSAGL